MSEWCGLLNSPRDFTKIASQALKALAKDVKQTWLGSMKCPLITIQSQDAASQAADKLHALITSSICGCMLHHLPYKPFEKTLRRWAHGRATGGAIGSKPATSQRPQQLPRTYPISAGMYGRVLQRHRLPNLRHMDCWAQNTKAPSSMGALLAGLTFFIR